MGLLSSGRFAVLDFETSGLSPRRGAEVVETGVVRIEEGRLEETFHALSRPLSPIPRSATAIHGITDAMVAGRPPFSEVLPDLLEFLGNRTIVAHNAAFDRAFLEAAVEQAGRRRLRNPFLDTVRLSRVLFPELERHDLATLCRVHRIPRPERHRGLADARQAAELLRILLARAEETGIETLPGLLEIGSCPDRGSRAPAPAREGTLRAAERSLLEEAIVTGDGVYVRCRSRAGGVIRHRVVPCLVDEVRDVPRLVAYDLERGVTRTFRLGEILGVSRPGEPTESGDGSSE